MPVYQMPRPFWAGWLRSSRLTIMGWSCLWVPWVSWEKGGGAPGWGGARDCRREQG